MYLWLVWFVAQLQGRSGAAGSECGVREGWFSQPASII